MAKRKVGDRKTEALAALRVLNPTPERVTDEKFLSGEFFDPRDLVQVKYEMLRLVSAEGALVTEAAASFGLSRPTFYEAQRALAEEGLAGLTPKRPGPKGAHKLTGEVMELVEALLANSPELTSATLAQEIERRLGLRVHPRSVERALARREKKRRRL